jgi:hypothetical protein
MMILSKKLLGDGFIKVVTPVKTGVRKFVRSESTDSGFRRNDGKTFSDFYETINR